MNKKIKCEHYGDEAKKLRVRIVRPPLVNTEELRNVILARARALVL